MGNSNSGRQRVRPYLGMFMRLGVSDVANLRDGEAWLYRWRNGSSMGVYGTRSGVEIRYGCDGTEVRQSLVVERIPCHFGGTRPLLRCPLCRRRCRWLYLYGTRFVCRVCTRAPYWTQTASPDVRTAHRIRRLQARLAPGVDVDDYAEEWVPRRPRGMRRATYRRLVERLEQAQDKLDAFQELALLRLLARFMTDDELDAVPEQPT